MSSGWSPAARRLSVLVPVVIGVALGLRLVVVYSTLVYPTLLFLVLSAYWGIASVRPRVDGRSSFEAESSGGDNGKSIRVERGKLKRPLLDDER